MGRNYEGSKKYLIQSLNETHKKMAQEMIVQGLRPSELAKQFNYSPMQISRIINSPVFKRYADYISRELLGEIKAKVNRDMHLLSDKALQTLNHTLNSEEIHARLKIKVALEVLDRIGVRKKVDSKEDPKLLPYHEKKDISKMSDEELWKYADKMFRDLNKRR